MFFLLVFFSILHSCTTKRINASEFSESLPDSKPIIKFETNYLLLCIIVLILIIIQHPLFEVNKWISEIIAINTFSIYTYSNVFDLEFSSGCESTYKMGENFF